MYVFVIMDTAHLRIQITQSILFIQHIFLNNQINNSNIFIVPIRLTNQDEFTLFVLNLQISMIINHFDVYGI